MKENLARRQELGGADLVLFTQIENAYWELGLNWKNQEELLYFLRGTKKLARDINRVVWPPLSQFLMENGKPFGRNPRKIREYRGDFNAAFYDIGIRRVGEVNFTKGDKFLIFWDSSFKAKNLDNLIPGCIDLGVVDRVFKSGRVDVRFFELVSFWHQTPKVTLPKEITFGTQHIAFHPDTRAVYLGGLLAQV